jgi:hypothetical protein
MSGAVHGEEDRDHPSIDRDRIDRSIAEIPETRFLFYRELKGPTS